jgi:glutathione synthase/RimK-type ligase-like ATP-grasp enzyme
VQKKHPDFPLIPQTYYSHPSCGSFPPDFPAVVKVGSSSQGVGKARVLNNEGWRDTLSLLSMSTEYFVTEPYIEWVSDIRVQKIGTHYRAIERKKMSEQSPWKANEPMGISEQDIPVKDKWREWIDAAAEELYMDMCGMDLIVDKNGKEFILEVALSQ